LRSNLLLFTRTTVIRNGYFVYIHVALDYFKPHSQGPVSIGKRLWCHEK